MIANKPKLNRFYQKLIEEENISHKKALFIYEALHKEAVFLGIINSENIFENSPKKSGEFRQRYESASRKGDKIKDTRGLHFSFTKYEKQAIKRARAVLMSGYSVKFASCEDTLIHKMFAGRAIKVQ